MRFSGVRNDTKWALIGGAVGVLFVLAIGILLTTPAKERLAADIPPAVERIIKPPITNPTLP